MTHNKVFELICLWRFAEKNPKLFQRKIQESLTACERHELGKEIQIHWNLPVRPLLSDVSEAGMSVYRRIAERINLSGDNIIPMGYAGANHSLLTGGELQKELAWASSNPWGTGFRDRFGMNIDYLMPHQMDFIRPSTRKLYSDMPQTWLIAPPVFLPRQEDQLSLDRLDLFDHGSLRSFPCIAPGKSSSGLIYRLLKKSIHRLESPLVIFLDFIYANEPAYIAEVLDALARFRMKNPIRFRRIDDSISGSLRNESEYEDPKIPVPHDPVDRVSLSDAAVRRSGILKKAPFFDIREEMRTVIEKSGASSRPGKSAPLSTETAENTPAERSLIADMPGTVLLKEFDFEMLFTGGRFTDIFLHGTPVLAGLPSNTYMTGPDTVYRHEPLGAYSFERGEVRGLREIVSLPTGFSMEPGKIVTDFLLVEDSSSLMVSCDAAYPVFPEPVMLQDYALLEIPVFLLDSDDTVDVRCFYPDEQQHTVTLPAADCSYEFAGCIFQFRRNDCIFTLEFPGIGRSPIEVLPVRIQPYRKQWLLTVNPRGNYNRSTTGGLSGFREHFTLLLRAGTGRFDSEDGFPAENAEPLLEEIQPSWISRGT